MAAPGWFKQSVHAWVLDLMGRAQRGESTDIEEGAADLWTRVTGHSEKQLAKALEEVLGAKELPIMLQGDMVHRVHVDRIAKYLVNRGTILDEEPDLFPAPLDQSYGAEGTSYRREAPRPYVRSDAVSRLEREERDREEADRFLREQRERARTPVGFVDGDGKVTPVTFGPRPKRGPL